MPLEPGAAEARRLLRAELSDPAYHRDDPSWVSRAVSWLVRQVGHLLDSVSSTPAGNAAAVVVLLALLVAGVLVVRAAPARRHRRALEPLFSAVERSAADHRHAADTAAASGDWGTAVRERLRAVVRDLEERAVLDVRPGRTADEAAALGAAALPGCAAALRSGSRVFDEVVYGRRPARREDHEQLLALDAAVRAARPGAAVLQ